MRPGNPTQIYGGGTDTERESSVEQGDGSATCGWTFASPILRALHEKSKTTREEARSAKLDLRGFFFHVNPVKIEFAKQNLGELLWYYLDGEGFEEWGMQVLIRKLFKVRAKNRVDDLQELFSNLQSARKESRTVDVAVLGEQVHQMLREWKSELIEPLSASSLQQLQKMDARIADHR